jgi:hypothetical protein
MVNISLLKKHSVSGCLGGFSGICDATCKGSLCHACTSVLLISGELLSVTLFLVHCYYVTMVCTDFGQHLYFSLLYYCNIEH